MSDRPSKVLRDALSLPARQRARLAASLIESLDEELDAEVDEAWRAEISRRVRELDEGDVPTVDWLEARAAILR